MNSVLIGTTNRGKVADFKLLFKKQDVQVRSLLDLPETIDVEETGNTFAENAILKAESISRRIGEVVIADDSGLVVDALNGRPGVYSARYAGEEKNDEANLRKVLEEMKCIPWEKRTARFVCVLAVAVPGRNTHIFKGQCKGYIAEKPSGDHGFGYDPIFYLPEKGRTMSELNPEEKNSVSHRRKAMEQLEKEWANIFRF